MTLETINGIRVLTPSNGMWLCNSKDKVISDKVYLGVNADETAWTEIDEAEKSRLEDLWETETDEPAETTDEYAEAGKILLGVTE